MMTGIWLVAGAYLVTYVAAALGWSKPGVGLHPEMALPMGALLIVGPYLLLGLYLGATSAPRAHTTTLPLLASLMERAIILGVGAHVFRAELSWLEAIQREVAPHMTETYITFGMGAAVAMTVLSRWLYAKLAGLRTLHRNS